MLRTILVQTERAINCADKHKPKVTRRDLNLESSVGDNADNALRDVFAVKKVMSKAGAFDFAPGDESTVVANDRFKKAIRNFQAGNDLAQDGKIFPGGPSIHALGFTAIGQENGRPSGYDAADFRQRTGRDGNRTQSGKPIFDIPGEGGGAGAPAAATTLPAGGEANAPFGGPLELTSAKSESATGGEIAGKTAQPVRPPVTQRQAERESVEKLTGNKNTAEGGDPGRNEILERAGFRFARSPLGGGRWLDIDGNRAEPNELRLIITNTIRQRALKENWSAGRILQELHKARSGLPFDDRKNVQTAFVWFLPLFGVLAEGGAAFSITGLLTALGLATVAANLSGDTPREKAGTKAAVTPKTKVKERDDEKESVIVYRVEGDPNQRIVIYGSGAVQILGPDRRMLFLNFGDRKAAIVFLREKVIKDSRRNWKLKSFRVPKEFLSKLRAIELPQKGARSVPGFGKLPQQVDMTKSKDGLLYGLREDQINALRNWILQGTGKEQTPKSLGINK